MCRLAAYRGPELFLDRLLNEEPHSLVTQSWDCRELTGTTLNADGFGFGWYTGDDAPAVYTSTLPIWADVNLAGLGKSLASRAWLACIRSATPGQAVSQANTQPFVHDRIMYLHNGRIEEFNAGPRARLHRFIDADIQAGIQGSTDSEYLFALFRHFLARETSIRAALLRCCNESGGLLESPALLTMVLSDGRDFFCCRHSVNGARCPTLYYSQDHPNFTGALVIASERFSHDDCWREIPEHACLFANAGETELLAL